MYSIPSLKYSMYQWEILSAFCVTIVIDLGIAGFMSFLLYKSQTGIKRTDSTLFTLIQYVISTGLLTRYVYYLLMVWRWVTMADFAFLSSVAALIYVLLVSPICLSHLPARLLSHHTAVHHKTQLFPLPSPRILNDKMYASFLAYTMPSLSKFSVYANSFLAMMNARGSLRDTISQPIDVEFNLGTSLRFDCSASTVGCTSPEGRKNSQSHVSDDV